MELEHKCGHIAFQLSDREDGLHILTRNQERQDAVVLNDIQQDMLYEFLRQRDGDQKNTG